MTSTLSCPECASPIALTPSQIRCPVCDSILPDSGHRDRRTAKTVPFVRDWVTDLRLSGGDFTRTAARTANAMAYESFRRGLRAEEIFEVARIAYYTVLGESMSTTSDTVESREHESDRGVMPLPEGRLEIGQTA